MTATESSGARKVILLLQGPSSPFLQYVGISLEKYNVKVRRILLCLGDRVFWSLPADWYRGKFCDWANFLAEYIKKHSVTDILMLGDGRPYHKQAIRVANDLGIRIHILEHGYLRPNWLTVEPDGMTSRSKFPRDPERILRLAKCFSATTHEPAVVWKDSFFRYAIQDLAFNLPNALLGWVFHRCYQPYAPVSPLIEYSGWGLKLLKLPLTRLIARKKIGRLTERLSTKGRMLFLFPLQLSGDYQIRVHSELGNQYDYVLKVMESFAKHCPQNADLLFKVHPLDNGLFPWKREISKISRRLDVADRVHVLDGGDLDKILSLCSGVITINSTVGLSALQRGVAVITLGNAIYDIQGLSYQGDLKNFWNAPMAPQRALIDAFTKLLQATIQVKGSFVAPLGIKIGAANVADRVVNQYPILHRLPSKPRHISFPVGRFD